MKSVPLNNKRLRNPKSFTKILYNYIKRCKINYNKTPKNKNKIQTDKSTKKTILTTTTNNVTQRNKVQNSLVLGNIISSYSSDSNLSNNSMQSSSNGKKIILQFLPIDDNTSRIMENMKYNPLLELTCSQNKTLDDIIKYLNKKWNRIMNSTITLLCERGKEIKDIYWNTLIEKECPIRLYYKWNNIIPNTIIKRNVKTRLHPTLIADSIILYNY